MHPVGEQWLPQRAEEDLQDPADHVDVVHLVQGGLALGPEETLHQLLHCPVRAGGEGGGGKVGCVQQKVIGWMKCVVCVAESDRMDEI